MIFRYKDNEFYPFRQIFLPLFSLKINEIRKKIALFAGKKKGAAWRTNTQSTPPKQRKNENTTPPKSAPKRSLAPKIDLFLRGKAAFFAASRQLFYLAAKQQIKGFIAYLIDNEHYDRCRWSLALTE